ncbi:hypothetical protein TNCV_124041 [Trichonephila clavipes]|nr:hypothetical protein TNCV_124041 [Trichonephila clavipes]
MYLTHGKCCRQGRQSHGRPHRQPTSRLIPAWGQNQRHWRYPTTLRTLSCNDALFQDVGRAESCAPARRITLCEEFVDCVGERDGSPVVKVTDIPLLVDQHCPRRFPCRRDVREVDAYVEYPREHGTGGVHLSPVPIAYQVLARSSFLLISGTQPQRSVIKIQQSVVLLGVQCVSSPPGS